TGAMYRALGYKLAGKGIPAVESPELLEVLDNTDIDFSEGNIILDGVVVNDKIRTPEISKMASDVSAIPIVRKKLVALQQKIAGNKSVIMDGRDIAEVVIPDAEYKYFMTASAEERAERRYKELIAKGEDVTFEKVLSDIEKRDYNDSHRAASPLRQVEGAQLLDTTGMSIEEVVNHILEEVRK
ncbi:MAG: (d)CMP kinase, partial [Firmicutes bacterium]|nr:(d)CMP kinase [Bacillota bacterium]